jgi:DNA modification methylase
MRKSNRSLLSNIIEFVDPATLQMPADLIHKVNALHIEKVSDSIESLDFLDPVLVGSGNEIIDGVSRAKAAIRQGLSVIPILRLPDATPNEMKAIRIALNKLPKVARWNETTLRTQVSDLIGQGFDVLKLGFDAGELDKLLAPLEVVAEAPVQVAGPDEPCSVIVGDAFTMGPQSIACGDCRDPDLIATLLGNEVAAACVMDPPYNVPIAGHVSGLGVNEHAEFAMASGEMTPEAFGEFLQTAMQVANPCIKPGGYQYVFMDWRSIHLLIHAGKAIGLDHINICTWVKPNAGMGSLYRSQHEMVGVFRKPGGRSTNNVQLGKYGRSRSNVWDYRGANSFGPSRAEDLKDHPTVKPVDLIEDIIKDCTKRGEIVLDLFGGSGTAMLAAERCGRRARLVEIEPRYVEVTLRRMRKMFGIDAIHVQTGLSFEELSEQRRQSAAVQPHNSAEGSDDKLA